MNNYVKDIQEVSSLRCLPWDKLSGCNILITGATGLIGSCLVDVLMNRKNINYDVYASGRNIVRSKELFKNYENNIKFHFLQYDVMSKMDIDIEFDYIIHAASNANPSFYVSNPVETMKANIFGVANLLDYGIHHNLKRFLYISSGEVYGEGEGLEFIESYSGFVDSMNPRSCYPTSKRAAETLCVSYCEEYDVECVIARPCHVYGPKFTEFDNRVYAQFIRNVLNHENIIMKSSGEQFRSWCYVVDCVSGILHILLKGENCNVYNIADSNSNVSIKTLAEMIAEIGGCHVEIVLPDEKEKKGYNLVKKSIYSTEKLMSLGWTVRAAMKENLISTIEYLRNVNNK